MAETSDTWINNTYAFICAVLILLCFAGFVMREAGLTQPKNKMAVLYRNLLSLAVTGMAWSHHRNRLSSLTGRAQVPVRLPTFARGRHSPAQRLPRRQLRRLDVRRSGQPPNERHQLLILVLFLGGKLPGLSSSTKPRVIRIPRLWPSSSVERCRSGFASGAT